jgi:two-component system, OmpR family, sensor kinase
MPIRWRLTFWFALILLVITVISGAVLDYLLQGYLVNRVDNDLRIYSARVHGTLHSDSTQGPLDYYVVHQNLPPINEFSSPGTYIELIDSNGRVVVKSDNLGSQELPVNPSFIERGFNGAVDIQTVSAGDNARVRIMISPLYTVDQTLLLEVAQSLQPIDSALRQMRLAIVIGGILALFLTAILGALLVHRTLAPVEKITKIARSIEQESNLDRRVGYKGPADEIGRLATTFDFMIAKLDKLFESQKRLVADASHELRTPLTVIQGNIDLLKRDIGEEGRKESLRAIETESKRMIHIANDLLLLAEIEGGQKVKTEEINLRELCYTEIQRASVSAGERKILFESREDLRLKGDVYKLRQLIGNLIDNAVKYTSENGEIKISLVREGDFARLEVSDNGFGIAQEHLPFLFNRFYRANEVNNRSRRGTGLGLAIVKEVAQQNGGKVSVTSEPGKGSVFTVWVKL